jgi:tetratricopeptide (TPR) repeat protein
LQTLAHDHPAVTYFQSDLAHFHVNLATLFLKHGRPSDAEPEYRASIAIQQKVVKDNPADTNFRWVLSRSHDYLGMLLSGELGKPAEAEAEYRKGLAIQQTLAYDNPTVTDFRAELATSHNNLGCFLMDVGKTAEAVEETRQAVVMEQNLAREVPTDLQVSTNLGVFHLSLGDALFAAGALAEAEAEHRKALAIHERLANDHPTLSEYPYWVSYGLLGVADAQRAQGRPAESLTGYDRAVTIREALVKAQPANPGHRADLAMTFRRRGLARRDLGDLSGASGDTRQALRQFEGFRPRKGSDWFERACCHAALAGLASQPGSTVPAAEEAREADTAVALLGKALAARYRNPAAYRTEPALDPLRGRADFKLLMLDLAMPDEPFATAR